MYDILYPLKINKNKQIPISHNLYNDLLSVITFISFNTIDEFKILYETIFNYYNQYKQHSTSYLNLIIRIHNQLTHYNTYEIFYDINISVYIKLIIIEK